jgi:hypothetical protein
LEGNISSGVRFDLLSVDIRVIGLLSFDKADEVFDTLVGCHLGSIEAGR